MFGIKCRQNQQFTYSFTWNKLITALLLRIAASWTKYVGGWVKGVIRLAYILTCRVWWLISYKKNQLDALVSLIYFWNETLHVSDSSSVHHQEFFTVHTAMVYVIQVFWQFASRIKMFRPDPTRKLSENLYDIRVYHCCEYSENLLMMDRGIVRNM